MQFQSEPAFRRRDTDLVPRPMLIACGALVAVALAFTTYAVVTDRPTIAQPTPAAAVKDRMLVLEGGSAQAVTVRAPDGSLIVALDHGGFITVVQGGLHRARLVKGVDQTLPVRLVEYANGRLALEDPSTGWSVELGAFGNQNKASWAALLAE
ncbi:MAG: photosynthetic complex assembly protein PuhC [Gemmobacter sp.]